MPKGQQSTQENGRAYARDLLERYGRTFSEEAGIRLERNTPAPLFQLLCLSMLLSAPIQSTNAIEAMRALRGARLTTARKMACASWQDRVDVITWHGYKRFDESGSTKLGENAQLLLEHYRGDLRKLRARAEGSVPRLETLLQEFKGIGKVGASIFLREVQIVWDEVYPYADPRVLRTARQLGFGGDAEALARLVPRAEYARFVSALVRVGLSHSHASVRRHAA